MVVTLMGHYPLLWLFTLQPFLGQHVLQNGHLLEVAHLRVLVAHGGLVPPGPASGLGTSGRTCANAARASAMVCLPSAPPSACAWTLLSCSGVAVLAATATQASTMICLPSASAWTMLRCSGVAVLAFTATRASAMICLPSACPSACACAMVRRRAVDLASRCSWAAVLMGNADRRRDKMASLLRKAEVQRLLMSQPGTRYCMDRQARITMSLR